MPIIDNFSSVYPNIILIEGMKQITDPPLYSALLKTFQNFENKPKENKMNEWPLYDESVYPIPVFSNNNTICLILIRTETDSYNIADPYITSVQMTERTLDTLFFPNETSWKVLWQQNIFGKVYLISSSKNHSDMAFVYQELLSQGKRHWIRYYPDRTKYEYQDIPLSGSSKVLALSIYQNFIVYSVEEGFYSYHFLIKNEVDDSVLWEEAETGLFHNRRESFFSETTGLKIFTTNNSVYMIRSIVTTNEWMTKAKLSVDILELSNYNWKSLGNLYNLTLNDYLIDTKSPEDLKNIPRIRVSNGNSIYIGHYGMALMYIRIL